MTFSNFLTKQLSDFVATYKHFWRTLGVLLIFASAFLIATGFLVYYSGSYEDALKTKASLLSLMFIRYSNKGMYNAVDLAKTLFVFFASLFSLCYVRMVTSAEEKNELSISNTLAKIKFTDLVFLGIALAVSAALDFILYQFYFSSDSFTTNDMLVRWLHGLFFHLRIYLPLLIFSLTLYFIRTDKLPKLKLKGLLFLYVSLWFINEFSYELYLYTRTHVFALILSPFRVENTYLFYESFLGLSLIAFYMLGYHSAMTSSIRIVLDGQNSNEASNNTVLDDSGTVALGD